MRIFNSILVTGGCGFMGSDFLRYLLKETSFSGKVVNLDVLTYAADPKSLLEVDNDPRYKFVKGNICDGALLRKLFKENEFDGVVHFAAESHVDRSIEDASVFVETNIVGTHKLLEASLRYNQPHFHLISTDEVYGSLGSEGLFTEGSTYRPNSPYAASKASADMLAQSYATTYGMSLTITHASNNFGEGQHKEKLIPKVFDAFRTGKDVTIYGDGTNVRSWIYVRDHSDVIWQLLQKKSATGVFNIDSGFEKSNLEVVDEILNLLVKEEGFEEKKLRAQIKYVKDRKGHDFRYAMSSEKLQKEISWKARISFLEGLKKFKRPLVC